MSAPERFAAAFGDWTPRAVVFDCDGLLLDTETVWMRAQDAVVAEIGAVLTPADDEALHGSTIQVAARVLAERAGVPEQPVLDRLEEAFAHELGDGVRRMPGAEAVVRAAAAARPLGCASNSWLSSLDEKLRAGGLREHFTVLEASDTVPRPKPAPDMYAAAARALGVEPSEALALEDSETGSRAAREAGLRLIAVPTHLGAVPAADLVLDSLEDPELAAWIATW